MRITGGLARSIQLKTLDLPELRPATDQMRQSIFNSIAAYVEGARFLDLFAGCGAYGLEAVSRGAASGVFVERHPKLGKIIKENLEKVLKSVGTAEPNQILPPPNPLPQGGGVKGGGFAPSIPHGFHARNNAGEFSGVQGAQPLTSPSFIVREADALKFSPEENSFDLVFCDPPYAMIADNWTMLGNLARKALKVGGLWLMEHPAGLNLPPPEGLEFRKNLGGAGKNSPNVAIYKKIQGL